VLRRRLPLSGLWVAATGAGMAVGMTLGQVVLGDDTAASSCFCAHYGEFVQWERRKANGQFGANRTLVFDDVERSGGGDAV
jgi:hypothetical protein